MVFKPNIFMDFFNKKRKESKSVEFEDLQEGYTAM